LYVERNVRPRRADDAIRPALVGLSRLIPWRELLIVVKPETMIRWHRKGFGLFWRWKSRPPRDGCIQASLRVCDHGVVRGEQLGRTVLSAWVAHYNRGRPHASLGPGIPDARDVAPVASGHRIPDGHRGIAKSMLAGLHHEYALEQAAA
jgi:hypothetical protein